MSAAESKPKGKIDVRQKKKTIRLFDKSDSVALGRSSSSNLIDTQELARNMNKIRNSELIWECLTMGTTLAQAIIVPYMIGFNYDYSKTFSGANKLDAFGCFNLLADIFFVFGLIGRYRKSLKAKAEMLDDMQLTKIATTVLEANSHTAYLGYRKFSFLIAELLACLPVDILSLCIGDSIYLLRLVKLFRVFVFPIYVTPILAKLGEKNIILSSINVRLVNDILSMAYSTHFITCLMVLLSHIECGIDLKSCDSTTPNWAINDNLMGASDLRVYSRSIWWIMNTVCTVGFGDITPQSDAEVIWFLFIMIWSMICSGRIIAGFTFAINTQTRDQLKFDSYVDNMKMFVKNHKIPLDIQNRIYAYLDYDWANRHGLKEVDLVSNLPPHLRREATYFLQGESIARAAFWKGRSETFFSNLSLLFKQRSFSPHDTIVVEGNLGHELFIMKRGSAIVLSKGKQVGNLDEGAVFGETAIFSKDHRREVTVKATTFCECYTLTITAFEEVLNKLYGDKAMEHREIIREKAESADKSKSKAKKMFGGESDEEAMERMKKGPGAWKIPDSSFRVIWDTIALVILIYYFLAIPYRMSFFVAEWDSFFHHDPSYSSFWIWFGFDLAFNVFLILDVILRSRFFAFIDISHTGLKMVVTDTDQIWQKYFRSGGFAWDVISSLPLDFLGFFIRVEIAWLFILPKFIRARHAKTYWENLLKFLEDSGTIVSSGTRKFSVLVIQIVGIIHIAACFWHYMGYLQLEENALHVAVASHLIGGNETTAHNETTIHNETIHSSSHVLSYDACLTDPTCQWLRFDHREGKSSAEKYLRSFYWAIDILTTAGYGDIRPFTTLETLFSFLWTYVACVIYYGVIGNLSSVAQSQNATIQKFQEQMDSINIYFRVTKLPHHILDEVRQYYNYMWNWRKGMDEEQILAALPTSLHDEIKATLYEKTIQNIYLFSDCNVEFIKGLISKLQQQIYMKGDYIVRDGDVGNLMFIIQSGRVEVLASDQVTCLAALSDGSCFGESSFLLNARRAVFVQAASLCNCSQLSKHDFEEVAALFPENYNVVVERAANQRMENDKLNKKVIKNFQNSKVKGMIRQKEGCFVKNVRVRYFIFSPTSRFRRWWNFIIFMVIMYTLWIVPFRLAFVEHHMDPYWVVFLVTDFLLDILFAVDIYLKAARFGMMEDGELVTDPARIFAVYKGGWFYWDLVASLPLYWYGSFSTTSILRIPRLLRMLQINDYFVLLQNFLAEINSRINSNSLILVRMFGVLMFCSHFFGSLFYFVSLQDERSGNELTWVTYDNIAGPDVPLTTKYLRSLYWGVSTLTVICYGDIAPRANMETAVYLLTAIVGIFVIANIIGTMGNLLMSFDRRAVEHQHIIDSFLKFSAKQELPQQLRDRVLQYYDFHYAHTRGLDVQQILDSFPTPMRLKVATLQYNKYITNLYTFEGFPPGLINSIAMALTPKLYIPNDFVIHQGDIGLELYIMLHGRGEVFSAVDQCVYSAVAEGSLIGEMSFFIPMRRQGASVRVITYSELLIFRKEDWDLLTDGMIELRQDVLKRCHEQNDILRKVRRNVRKNLINSHSPGDKLHKVIFDIRDILEAEEIALNGELKGHRNSSSLLRNLSGKIVGGAAKPSSSGYMPGGRLSGSRLSGKSAVIPVSDGIAKQGSFNRFNTRKASLEMRELRRESELRKLAAEEELMDELESLVEVKTTTRTMVEDVTSLCESIITKDAAKLNMPGEGVEKLTAGTSEDIIAKRVEQEKLLRGGSSRFRPSSASKDKPQNLENTTKGIGEPLIRGGLKRGSVPMIADEASNDDSNSTKKFQMSVWVRSKPPRAFTLPFSRFRRYWDLLSIIITLYFAVVIPFRFCFMENDSSLWAPYQSVLKVWLHIEQVTTAFFIAHIVFNWQYFAINEGGNVITDSAIFSELYLRKWLILDVFIAIPFDLIYLTPLVSATAWQTFAGLKLNKLLFLFHLPKILRMGETYLVQVAGIRMRPSTLRFIKTMASIMLLAHWIACMWYYVGMQSGGFQSGWMSLPHAILHGNQTETDITTASRWLRSVHYAINSLTTVALGDIRCITVIETAFQFLVTFLSCGTFAIIIGCLEKVIHDADSARTNFEVQMQAINWYLQRRKFEPDLCRRINGYYSHLWTKHEGVNVEAIMSELPTSLSTEIALFINCEVIQRVELFDNCEQAFIDAIALVLKPQILLPHEFVIREGEIGNELYFVNGGVLRVFNNAKQFEVEKSVGDYFGELALLLDQPRNANVQAITECDLLVFHRVDYERILKYYPEYREHNKKKWIKPHMKTLKRAESDGHLLTENRVTKKKDLSDILSKAEDEMSLDGSDDLKKSEIRVKEVEVDDEDEIVSSVNLEGSLDDVMNTSVAVKKITDTGSSARAVRETAELDLESGSRTSLEFVSRAPAVSEDFEDKPVSTSPGGGWMAPARPADAVAVKKTASPTRKPLINVADTDTSVPGTVSTPTRSLLKKSAFEGPEI